MMPPAVLLIALVQVLLAATFVIAAVVALRYGRAAQRAADAEVVRQGFAARTLARHRVRFEESATEALLPIGIAAVLLAVALLNLSGTGAGPIASWVLHPVLLVAGGFVTAGQVFADRYVAAALRRSGEARGIDARAVVSAARSRFPSWLRALLVARFTLATAGSVVVIALLAVPSAAGR